MALTEEQLKVFADFGVTISQESQLDLLHALIAALPKPEAVAWVDVINRNDGPYNFNGMKLLARGKHILYTEAPLAQPASAPSEQKPRFECWSTNEGDSWYEHPADAELLYDVLGNSPKVGDEFEVMAGWCSVPARYRIVSQKDDDFEVECISHPEDNAAPQPDYKAQRDALLEVLQDALSLIESLEWSNNKWAQCCPVCCGKSPEYYENKSKVGHEEGCDLSEKIASVRAAIASVKGGA